MSRDFKKFKSCKKAQNRKKNIYVCGGQKLHVQGELFRKHPTKQ